MTTKVKTDCSHDPMKLPRVPLPLRMWSMDQQHHFMNIPLTWNLARNADSQVPPQTR